MENKIPKIIHYCWFGSKQLPKTEKKCIDGWKHKLKGYTFKLWNEDSFDVEGCSWTRDAYKDKKYAFVADYVRLYVLYQYGGIYLDTDIKVLKNFDDLLDEDAFMGFEDGVCLSCGVIGVQPKNAFIKKVLDIYDDEGYLYGEHKTANVKMITELMCDEGLKKDNSEQFVAGFHVFPKTYFNPMDYFGNWDKTKKTYCIHLYSGSWLDEEEKNKLNSRKKLSMKIKKRIYGVIRNVYKKFKSVNNDSNVDLPSGVKKGKNVDIINSFIDYGFGFLVTIGDNVTITNATILAHDASTKKELGYSKVGRVDIGSNVFIGYGSIVLPNTRIGNKVIVGAGTVVAKDIPDNSVVVGNPMRLISSYDEYMEKNKKRMEEIPVFNTLFTEKTDKQKQEEFELLSDFRGGYDL